MPSGAIVAIADLQSEGPARLLERKQREVLIRFLASGAEMTVEERRVARYCLLPGTSVQVEQPGGPSRGEIAARPPAKSAGNPLLVYAVRLADGAEISVREDAILAVPAARDPGEQLRIAAFHDLCPGIGTTGPSAALEPLGAQTLTAREELLSWRSQAWAASGGVTGLMGARVRALPHQLITAARVLGDRQVRFLLADEVGLGKTIEAGLIMQSLLALRPGMRVLIVVPGALTSQWFLELYVKFGGRRFIMLDGERLEKHPGNPWNDEQFLLVSSHALEELEGKGSLRLAQARWDLLIVDECHRMQPGGSLYRRIASLSKHTPHVLLLSATPPRQRADAYLALLALLQPHAYRPDALPAFAAKVAVHERVVALMVRTSAATAEAAKELGQAWVELLGADPVVQGHASALAGAGQDGFEAARAGLLAHVREHHQLDHRIIRHRRAVLARLSQASGVAGLALSQRRFERIRYRRDRHEQAVRTALAAYRSALMARFAAEDAPPPARLAHWLLQLELAAGADAAVLERLLAMRAAVAEEPEAYGAYRARARPGENAQQVLRNDLSEHEISGHIAVSAACNVDPAIEAQPLATLRAAVDAWNGRAPARRTALIRRLQAFWQENPQEKVVVFTGHALAVAPLAEGLADAFGAAAVETFGAHLDTLAREENVRRFREEDACPLLVCDPLGGEGRNFQFVSLIVHHDLPWSVAAVEQRIGRVDRIGRDGEVPSWVLGAEDGAGIDDAWSEILETAVGVFSASASGLEFVCDDLESRALNAALRGGAAGLRAELAALTGLVAGERAASDAREDELFSAQAQDYSAAAQLAARLEATSAPRDAVLRWIRGMGGSARREEEPPRAFRLRTRFHHEPETGVFDRESALSRPDLSFFTLGNGLIDRLMEDAEQASWCAVAAWRRTPSPALARWDGIRVAYQMVLDLGALARAQLPLDCLRHLLVEAGPARNIAFIRCTDARLEEDPVILAQLSPPFDSRLGDRALSLNASREFWTRPLLGGKPDQILTWQGQIVRAMVSAQQHAQGFLPAQRDPVRAAYAARARIDRAVIQGQAAAAAALLPAGHPDIALASAAAAEQERMEQALLEALSGARMEIVSVCYIAVA